MRSLESLLSAVPRPLPPVSDSRSEWRSFRRAHGYVSDATLMGKPDSNAKLSKGDSVIFGLTLIPHEASGYNACPFATEGCASACVLMTAGRGVMSNVRKGRKVRTLFAAERPAAFLSLLLHELTLISKRNAIVRLNVASDIRWERVLPEAFDLNVEYYDYTKWPMRSREPRANYRIVYSRNERDGNAPALDYVREGGTAAVVFDVIPETWQGLPVINGDKHDDRISDPDGVIVGLRAKGSAKSDTSGFVVNV